MCQATIVVGMVLSRAIVRDMVPQDEAASMIGWVTMGMAIVPMLGPALGGVLDQTFGWKANFWVQIVAGLGVLWLIWSDVGETGAMRGGSFRSQFGDLPELIRSRRFWGYALAAAFCSGSFFAYLGGAPFVGSDVFGLSPAALGIFFGAPAVGYAVGNGISGRYSVRYGINSMILWGSLLTMAGLMTSILVFALGFGSAVVFFGFTTFVGLGQRNGAAERDGGDAVGAPAPGRDGERHRRRVHDRRRRGAVGAGRRPADAGHRALAALVDHGADLGGGGRVHPLRHPAGEGGRGQRLGACPRPTFGAGVSRPRCSRGCACSCGR